MVTEKLQLLGKGVYDNIPDELTLCSLPTSSELDYVGSEDFHATMIDKVLPKAIEEKIDCGQLLEPDYYWVLRALRILNYGPYHTTNTIYCGNCGNVARGEYQVNLETIECKPFPAEFVNHFEIQADEFIEFDKSISFKIPTIRQVQNAKKDKAFKMADGSMDSDMAKICYMITAVGSNSSLSPIEIKWMLEHELTSADFKLLSGIITELSDYGLRAGGTAQCPSCGSMNAIFLTNIDDKFFRPTVGDLRKWRDDRSGRKDKNIPRAKKTTM